MRAVLSHHLDLRADRAAVREVELGLNENHVRIIAGDGGLVLDGTHIGLVSRGSHPVTLTAIEMIGGAKVSGLRQAVDSNGTDVLLPAGRDCRTASLVKPPTAFRLTLRTYRGTSLVRALPLGPADAARYAQDERMRCGYPPVALALGFDIEHSEVVGRTLVVHFRLFNSTIDDLVATRLQLSPGLSASGIGLPLRLLPTGRHPEDVRRRP